MRASARLDYQRNNSPKNRSKIVEWTDGKRIKKKGGNIRFGSVERSNESNNGDRGSGCGKGSRDKNIGCTIKGERVGRVGRVGEKKIDGQSEGVLVGR